ncbi:MAG: hypothetical protein Q8L53_10165 [Aestuariivirga sp.]|nr:hypothetical protein [Aestuariivirga sp.]
MRSALNLASLFGMVLGLPLLSTAAVAVETEPVGEVVPYIRPACISFRNLKTDKPEVFNNCNEPHTIGLAFFNGEEYIRTQVYHVWRKTKRPFKHLGDFVVVDWVKAWTNDGSDDGSKFLSLSAAHVADDEVWHAKNTSPDQYNAFTLKVFYKDWPTAQMVQYVLAPGESAPMVRVNHDTGRVYIEWSRLDPE